MLQAAREDSGPLTGNMHHRDNNYRPSTNTQDKKAQRNEPMTRKRARNLHDEMMQSNTTYVREYSALEKEFSLTNEIIRTLKPDNVTLQELAEKIKAALTVIVRMEKGNLP